LTVNFLVYPLAKFSKNWQTGIGSKYVTILIVRARFSGISTKPVFTAVKDKFAKIINCLYKPYFLCLKFVYYWMQCAVKILGIFTNGNSRKSSFNYCLLHATCLSVNKENANTSFKTKTLAHTTP